MNITTTKRSTQAEKIRLLRPASFLPAGPITVTEIGTVGETCSDAGQGVSSLEDDFCKGAALALNIKDPATEKCVRELASVTGETVTAAIRRAAEERLQRVRRGQGGRSLADEIMEIARRCAALPDQDTRTADEILGYDRHGLPG